MTGEIVSVLTTPRRPMYLAGTCAALLEAGARTRDRFVWSDGMSYDGPPEWMLFTNDGPPLGDRHAMWAVMRQAVEWGVTTLAYFEDDAGIAPQGVNTAFAEGVPEHLALVSLYDSAEFKLSPYLKAGLHEVPIMGSDGKGLRGAVALMLPRRTIEWALHTDPDAPGIPQGSDAALSWALRDGPWRVRGVREPSLAEHLGDESALGHGPGRRASWFAGGRR